MTSFEEFSELCKQGNVIPVHETLRLDTETPVSVYLRIKDQDRYSFLLESVEGGESVARYSFLGFNPFMKCEIRGGDLSVEALHDDVTVLPKLAAPGMDPVEALKAIFAHLKTVRIQGLPRFSGGAVGYFGYECIRLVENIPQAPGTTLAIPDAVMLFFDVVLVFDNVTHSITLVSNAYVPEGEHRADFLRREYDKARAEIESLKSLLRTPPHERNIEAMRTGGAEFVASKADFCRGVDRVKQYISEGDVFQVVLSQQVRMSSAADPFTVYRNLRTINPSPYMYFLRIDDLSVIGSSPEMLVRVVNRTVETRPIAGTRRRGKTPQEDTKLEQELRSDSKELAEHLMLVDLGRNDLGRICNFGTVVVSDMMRVEKYSHVMHLVSEVRGTLRSEVTPLDALLACFPAGTVSGAPKIRAMEIIAELEPQRRGIYGGAVAYLDFSGNLDSCIAIRTIVGMKGTYYLQAGAGIVYDSIPEREYEETLEKLGATIQALEEQGR